MKILDNKFISKKENRGRKPKRDIDGFVRNLTREQLEEIAKVHIQQNENKKDKSLNTVISLKKIWLLFWIFTEQPCTNPKWKEYMSLIFIRIKLSTPLMRLWGSMVAEKLWLTL